MYLTELFNKDFTKLSELASLQNLINLILFLLLAFVGTGVRLSIDVEFFNKKVKGINFANRWFIATVLSYVIEVFISDSNFFRKYYSESIIVFCIFVNDIMLFILHNLQKILIYLLNALTKGVIDLRNTTDKNKDNDSTK